jgi:hypothetical protein
MDSGPTDNIHLTTTQGNGQPVAVAVGIPVTRYPRTGPYVRSLAHTALVSDAWRHRDPLRAAHPYAPGTRVSRTVSGTWGADECSP